MASDSAAVKERHEPLVLVETAGLSEAEWLAYRRKGIGGSDVAALLGVSPWRTARDLFYDKLNIVAVEDSEDNWVALEMGHLLEPLVAKIFQHRTGYKVYQVKKMFQHPKYPWMLADVDYFVEVPDGTTAILEIKTTNYNAKDHWWLDGEETVPVYYEYQGRHYMAVMDVDRCFFCCLYGNNEEESIIREIQRNQAYEDEMIFLEQYFWQNHVLTKTPPPYTEEGNLVIESVRRHTGPANKDAPVVTLDLTLTAKLKLSFKEQYLCGLCELVHIEDCTEQWQHRAENTVGLTEYLGLTRKEHEAFLQQGKNALASLLDPQRRKQRFLLYQLELDEQNAIPFAFKDVEALKKAGYEQPPAAQYRLVWTGEIYCPTEQSDAEVLKRLFSDFSEELPEGCCGRQIALSDVIELDHEPKWTYYYVSGQNDFRQVRFSPMLAKKDRPEGI